MKLIIFLSRFLVAITFIFSGFVKLVDPLGSAYKFQEYFGANVLNFEFLIPYALPFSIVLIIAELMLGVFLLVGYFPKTTVFGLLAMILVFLFLTWYSAYYNKVIDCGCFGDALKISPWQTFYKNIILVILIIILVVGVKKIKPLWNLNFVKWISFLSFFAFLYITYHVLTHLPIIDFRPYAIGKNISEGMKYNKEKPPLIYDFFLENMEGNDVTDLVLSTENVLLVVAYNLSESDREGFKNIKKVTDLALKKGYMVYALTASLNEDFLNIKKEFNLNFEMLFCDETTLKTIIRANPGIVVLQKGTVVEKRNWIDYKAIFDNE